MRSGVLVCTGCMTLYLTCYLILDTYNKHVYSIRTHHSLTELFFVTMKYFYKKSQSNKIQSTPIQLCCLPQLPAIVQQYNIVEAHTFWDLRKASYVHIKVTLFHWSLQGSLKVENQSFAI